VLIRLLEVLTDVLAVETSPARRAPLRRHADLALAAGQDGLEDAAGLADLRARHAVFLRAL